MKAVVVKSLSHFLIIIMSKCSRRGTMRQGQNSISLIIGISIYNFAILQLFVKLNSLFAHFID